jgi:predicted naringenin-chalcone synthase
MSSPSVLFVLAEAMRTAPPMPGTYGVLAAFGPGLGIEAALIRFDA